MTFSPVEGSISACSCSIGAIVESSMTPWYRSSDRLVSTRANTLRAIRNCRSRRGVFTKPTRRR